MEIKNRKLRIQRHELMYPSKDKSFKFSIRELKQATGGNRKVTFRMPRQWSLPDFQTGRLYQWMYLI